MEPHNATAKTNVPAYLSRMVGEELKTREDVTGGGRKKIYLLK